MSSTKRSWRKWISQVLGTKPEPRRVRRGCGSDRPNLRMEELESRVVPAIDLMYATDNVDANFTLDADGFITDIAGLASTNFLLRAEKDGGQFFWRLYATGVDLLPPFPPLK